MATHTYDSFGRKVATDAAGVVQTSYAYDTAGRLVSIDSPAGTFSFTYDGLGRRAELVYPNDTKATYVYDERGRLVSLVHTGLGGEVLRSFAYGLDAVGNRIVKETERDTLTYSYDTLYRLVGALSTTPGWSGEEGNAKGQGKGNSLKGSGIANALLNQMETYAYDSMGNRLTGPDGNDTYTYNSANQLVSSSFADFGYDPNGNLIYKVTDDGLVSYRYDYENRLVRVEMPTGTVVEFAYGPFGHRIGRAVNGQWTYYFYDNEDILYEYSQSGTIGNMYVHGRGIDEPLALMSRKGNYYYHADGLGSIVALTDKNASVVQDYEYDSFGNLKDRKNRIKQPYAFTGREWDADTGLYYYRARYYDAEAGRFTQKDPLGYEELPSGGSACGSSNKPKGMALGLYHYVNSNPVNYLDPTGLFTIVGDCCGLEDRLRDEIYPKCNRLKSIITDPKLLSCIDKSCWEGTIRCCDSTSNDFYCSPCSTKTRLGTDSGGKTFGVMARRYFYLCASNIEGIEDQYGKLDLGNVAIHEWAHGCGWDHNGGKGVPAQSGNYF